MSKARKQYSSSEKVGVLREHLLDKREVSEICEEKGLQPSVYYRWQLRFWRRSPKNTSVVKKTLGRPERRLDSAGDTR